jgi:predicted kinase
VAERASQQSRDADALERSLADTPSQPPLVLVVMVGLPGSGKSHLARQIALRHPAAILDSDRLRATLFAPPVHSVREHKRLFPAIHELAGRLLSRNVSVIVDATNLKESNRKPFHDLAKKHNARLVIVRAWAPAKTVRERLSRRETTKDPDDQSTATLAVHDRMRQDVERVRGQHVSVNTALSLDDALDKIAKLIEAD